MARSYVESIAFQPPLPSYRRDDANVHYCYPEKDAPIPYYHIVSPHTPTNMTLLYTHGNAEDMGQMFTWGMLLAKHLKVNVVLWDYAGYGHNGRCGEAVTNRNIYAIFTMLTRSIRPQDIILYGRSLGTGPTVYLAADLAKRGIYVGGVILQSPILSAVSVMSEWLALLPFTDIFPSYSRIGAIRSPIFILHGDRDRVVPYDHGQKLHRRCAHYETDHAQFWSVRGAGHNDIEANHASRLFEVLTEFLRLVQETDLPLPSPEHGGFTCSA